MSILNEIAGTVRGGVQGHSEGGQCSRTFWGDSLGTPLFLLVKKLKFGVRRATHAALMSRTHSCALRKLHTSHYFISNRLAKVVEFHRISGKIQHIYSNDYSQNVFQFATFFMSFMVVFCYYNYVYKIYFFINPSDMYTSIDTVWKIHSEELNTFLRSK